MPPEFAMDTTDGLRVTFEGGGVIHMRPSGNAPEFRCYAEASTPALAKGYVADYLALLGHALAYRLNSGALPEGRDRPQRPDPERR